ncbi:MAG: hypothetical protein QXU39_02335 [Candidatus Pacearchaeota archaeon]
MDNKEIIKKQIVGFREKDKMNLMINRREFFLKYSYKDFFNDLGLERSGEVKRRNN